MMKTQMRVKSVRRALGVAAMWLCLVGAGQEEIVVPADVHTEPPMAVRFTGAGELEGDSITVKRHYAQLLIGDAESRDYTVIVPLRLGASHHMRVILAPDPEQRLGVGRAHAMMTLNRDKEGWRLLVRPSIWNEADGKWQIDNAGSSSRIYWPTDAKSKEPATIEGIAGPRRFTERTTTLRMDVGGGGFRFWIDGEHLSTTPLPLDGGGQLVMEFMQDDVIGKVTVRPFVVESDYLPVSLEHLDLAQRAQPVGQARLESAGVPFELAREGAAELDVSRALWREMAKDPASYYENYDAGPEFVGDPRQPMVRVPIADYVAAHLLAVAEASEESVPMVTLRAGLFNYAGQTVQHEFAAEVPTAGAGGNGIHAVTVPGGMLYHVRIPMDLAFAQDLQGRLDIEITKEVRLARRRPDPARFRYRPAGLPSGVKILAMTLEKSPLRMRVFSDEAGHAFEQPAAPLFKVALSNVTGLAQAYQLQAVATHFDGTRTETSTSGTVPAGQAVETQLSVPYEKLGYHKIAINLIDGEGNRLLTRHTSFAVLPEDSRRHRDISPMGTWDFFGGHFTPNDADLLGPLYRKAGLRYGMFSATSEARRKWGVVQGTEPKVSGSTVEKIEEWFAKNPDADRVGLLWHEDAISGSHISRIPDLFHDRADYQMDEQEQARFKQLWDAIVEPATALRAAKFDIHLRLGNGGLPQKEELYRNKFPAELFDSVGNEAGVFGRPPEAQPPDWVANNASLWMDRVMADHYGYRDKPVTQCYEITYPSTNPGNLSLATQADYFVRHAIHSMAWEVPTIRVGLITDVGNSYYFSNWGAAGLCHAAPEINVKPSFVTMATMTRVLDGAAFSRVLELGSASLHGVEFARQDGRNAYVLWCLKGTRSVTLTMEGAGPWSLIDGQGNSTDWQSGAAVELSPSPVYLLGEGRVTAIVAGSPLHTAVPSGNATVLSTLENLDGWSRQADPDPVLDYHNFMAPRRHGDFSFEAVPEFEGRQAVLKVTPKPLSSDNPLLAMPMYSILMSNGELELPGQPTGIGIWVNGNSSQGRIIFDLIDANGERWTSIGAPQAGEPTRWMLDWMPEAAVTSQKKVTMADWNTNDVFGLSRIDFDGWRFLEFPLPGNYPGERYPWPASSQWRHDQDGIVDYPLTVRAIIVELPEKTLHMKSYAPVERPDIYLRDLTAVEGNPRDHQPRGFNSHE